MTPGQLHMKTCKTCHTPLLKKATKPNASQLQKQYYYTHYYFCPNCKKMYLSDEFKVTNQNYSLFTNQTVMSNAEVEIWTDGACSNNGKESAKASWAFVSGEHEEAGMVEGKQTNNRGEAFAIYHALKWAAEKGYKTIRVHSDSQITLHGVAKDWQKVKENQDIFHKIHQVISENDLTIDYQKVLGHSGDVNNERADKAATSLLSSTSSSQS